MNKFYSISAENMEKIDPIMSLSGDWIFLDSPLCWGYHIFLR